MSTVLRDLGRDDRESGLVMDKAEDVLDNKSIVESDFDKIYNSDRIKEAEEESDLNDLIKSLADDYGKKNSSLEACNYLPPRDLFLSVLISNGTPLDEAFLKAVHFDNPKMYLMNKKYVMNQCKKYIMERPVLCKAVVELKDKMLEQYTYRAKINKNVVLREMMRLKELCMDNPATYGVALNSLKLIGLELGMFGNNPADKTIARGINSESNNVIDINVSINEKLNNLTNRQKTDVLEINDAEIIK